ncbi:MAG: T9SS type A sorting domain-containing protein [Flavisolibacter sp.]|nr:T9SS type A sorting domain-containing protein [Flavisolibacter sp.]
MRLFLSLLMLLAVFTLSAQRECAVMEYSQQLLKHYPALAVEFSRVDAFIEQKNSGSSSRIGNIPAHTIIRIPVVVHILYATAAQNISDEQVKSQLAALNRDFRKKNGDTSNTPLYFKPLAADVEIEFYLATADPKGRATTGIVRKKTAITEFGLNDKIKFTSQGGDDAWDTKSYLNVWVGPMIKLLGYASAPGSPVDKDGVVINVSAFGTVNTAAPYHLGRTTVHEVGHWLGLKHIWGDVNCGDDGIEDTPVQAGFTKDCPSGVRTTCGNAPTGDMYMNYMDFTNDACLNIFTHGQRERMRRMFDDGGPRNSLLFSKGLDTPWLSEAVLPIEQDHVSVPVSVFPNPVTSEVKLSFGNDYTWIGKELSIINMNGIVVQKQIITSGMQRISMNHLPAGFYIIKADNGTKELKEKLVKL